jgi:hypothetical protein
MAIQQLDLGAVYNTLAQKHGQDLQQQQVAQQGQLNALQMARYQREDDQAQRKQNALSRLASLSPDDKEGRRNALFEAAPEYAAKAEAARLFPTALTGKDRYIETPNGLYDLGSQGGPKLVEGSDGGGYTDINGNPVGGNPIGGPPRVQVASVGNAVPPSPARTPAQTPPRAVPAVYQPTIAMHAERTGLDAGLIGAVFMQESGGRQEVVDGRVVSSAGAEGPMQTMPNTLKDPGYGVTPAQDGSVDEKFRVWTDYLAAMMKKYNGNKALALGAYNWGPGNVDNWLANGADVSKVPAETRKYLRDIMGDELDRPHQPPQEQPGVPPPRPTGGAISPLVRNGKVVPGWGVDANGQTVPTGNNTTVNVDTKGATKEQEAIGTARGKQYEGVMTRATGAQDTINQVRLGRALADTDAAGKELPTVLQNKAGAAATALGLDVESPIVKSLLGRVSDGQSFNATMMELVLKKQTQQVGPQTDKDAENIKATLGSLGNTPAARDFLLRTAEAQSQRDIDKLAFYEKHMEANSGSTKGAEIAWNKHVNSFPLFGVNPTSKKPVFYQEFQAAVHEANPDASEEDVLGLWRSKYGRSAK